MFPTIQPEPAWKFSTQAGGHSASHSIRGAVRREAKTVTGLPCFARQRMKRARPATWSECSWVIRTASISSGLSPISARRRVNSRTLRPASIRIRVFDVARNAAFPVLPLASTQNLTIQFSLDMFYQETTGITSIRAEIGGKSVDSGTNPRSSAEIERLALQEKYGI